MMRTPFGYFALWAKDVIMADYWRTSHNLLIEPVRNITIGTRIHFVAIHHIGEPVVEAQADSDRNES